MINSPFRSPYTLKVEQEFGNTSNNAWYKAHGIFSVGHNGIDITFGNPKQTYGTECICPFDSATVVKVTFTSPTSTSGNGITIESSPINGVVYQVVFWHTGEIAVKIGQKLKLGDVICYIGNSGLCDPEPSKDAPWNGAHCHLMLFKKTWNGNFWVYNSENTIDGAINPRELFDFTQWYQGQDTGLAHDAWVLKDYLSLLSPSNIVKYLKKLGL